MDRRYTLPALVVALLVCVGLPSAAFAAYNTLFFLREQLGLGAPPTQMPATPSQSATAEATLGPVCGGPPAMFILLIGSDSRATNYAAGLADSVRVVRVDFVDPGVTHLSFQRDLYVEIPGIADHGGITHGKLSQAYLYGNPAFNYYDDPGQGPGLLALTLQHNFGARADHHVAVNLQAFARIVDQLGGLDINLPYTVDGRAARSTDQSKYFPAGPLHLDGYRAMLLARMRPNGDLERSHTQDLMLQALGEKLLSPTTLPLLPAMVESLYGSVQTDLGAPDIAALLCLAAELQPADLEALNFPDGLFTGTRIQDPVLGRTFVWDVDFGQLRDYVSRFSEGSWLIDTPETPGAPTP